MDDIVLWIDGREARGKKGDTILEVCKKNNIYVPTLCHFPGLPNAGSCRMCIVQIEGVRGVNTSCTTPALDGMRVRTDTKILNDLRKDILQLIFAERNHFCMFCEMSGDCELQSLAYKFGIDHFNYPFMYPKLPVDSSNKYFVLDHNRCILCTRCVRVCSSKAGFDVLGVAYRSSKAIICADLNFPIGESNCTSCWACVQICPTGALFETRVPYRRRRIDSIIQKTVCRGCSVGCGVEAIVRTNNVVTIEGDYDSDVNQGLLCVKGRFKLIGTNAGRILNPQIRKDGVLEDVSWDKALDLTAEKLNYFKTNNETIAGVVSPMVLNESLFVFKRLFNEILGNNELYTLDSEVDLAQSKVTEALVGKKNGVNIETTLEDVRQADCYLIVGFDPNKGYGVLESFIRRNVKQKAANLIIIHSEPNSLSSIANVQINSQKKNLGAVVNAIISSVVKNNSLNELASIGVDEEFILRLGKYKPDIISSKIGISIEKLNEAAKLYAFARKPAIIYGEEAVDEAGTDIAISLAQLAIITRNFSDGRLRLLAVRKKANSRGAADMGYVPSQPENPSAVFFLMSDEFMGVPKWVDSAKFVVVRGSHRNALSRRADVVFPAPYLLELQGSFISTEGRIRRFDKVVESPKYIKSGWEFISALADKLSAKMGIKSNFSYDCFESVREDMVSKIPACAGAWVPVSDMTDFNIKGLPFIDYISSEKVSESSR